MTEKKTFKNPAFVSGFTYLETPRWSVYQTVNGSEGVEFPHNEWDMEVTFTKKVKPFEVGDQVLYYGSNVAEIIGIFGDFLWLYDETSTPMISTCPAHQVRNVEPWQPV